jgi:ApbE superfamily uncharacterized protein (UPF0280 family)
MIESVLFQEKETIVTIISEPRFIRLAKESILFHRNELESFIRDDPFFMITYEPYPCPSDAPEVVKRMCNAARKAGVGPMAAVAGAIAELAVRAMVEGGATHAIVENGGDIAMVLDRPVTVGIYTGESKIRDIGFRIIPEGNPAGLCTSSGFIGPSVSLGNTHASTVYVRGRSLNEGFASDADAFATALGNLIKDDQKKRIESALSQFSMKGIDGGLMVVTEGHIAMRGTLPEIIRLSHRALLSYSRILFPC